MLRSIVFTHLSQPWILTRLVLGFLSMGLTLVASFGAIRLFVFYRTDAPPDVRTLQLERQSELVATALGAAFVLELLAALFTVLTADRLAGSLRGAMCAYGVIHASPWGVRSVTLSWIAAMSASAWLGAWRVDHALRRGSLIRWLAGFALCVSVLVVADTVTAWKFLMGLDLEMTASCCSVFVDSQQVPGVIGGMDPTGGALIIGAIALVSAMVSSFVAWRRPGVITLSMASLVGVGAAFATVHALANGIAPYVYETPAHKCIYCLFHHEHGLAGPVAVAALTAAALCSAAMVSIAWVSRRDGARVSALDVGRSVSASALFAWSVVLVAALWALVGYRIETGTFSLAG